MDSQLEDICLDLSSGSFQDAEKKTRNLLSSFSLSEKNSREYQRASEAFVYAKFFLHRQDSISRIQADDQRARYYRQLLKDLNEIRVEKKYEKYDNPLWSGVDNYLYSRIAENYARAFAGQKSYNLDQDEIIELSISLLKLEKWRSAIESLDFLLRLNQHSAKINFLLAYPCFKTGLFERSQRCFRYALFYKPEIISEYPEFLPGETIEKYWYSFVQDREITESVYREFALLLELNDVYKTPLELKEKEVSTLEKDFQQKMMLYEKKEEKANIDKAELLHYLCWLLTFFLKSGNYEKHEFYRSKMISISPDSWETFQNKKNL